MRLQTKVPCAYIYIYISMHAKWPHTHVKDPALRVKVWWIIYENTETTRNELKSVWVFKMSQMDITQKKANWQLVTSYSLFCSFSFVLPTLPSSSFNFKANLHWTFHLSSVNCRVTWSNFDQCLNMISVTRSRHIKDSEGPLNLLRVWISFCPAFLLNLSCVWICFCPVLLLNLLCIWILL